MEATQHLNFVGMHAITVQKLGNDKKYGPIIGITQFGGAMHFHHAMTVAQARELAAALIAHADAVEAA